MEWYALPASLALTTLDSSDSGLTDSDAARRLAAHGPNELPPPPRASAWRLLAGQLASLMTLLLTAAAAVALITGDEIDAATIAAVLVLNVALGVATEWRARRAMEALRSLEVPTATVVRGGQPRIVPARDLVPGDIIVLDAGGATPADSRLISTTELSANEAALTGESLPVAKHADAQLPDDAPLAERRTMVFKATMIVGGSGRAVVVATGSQTEIGRIGALTSAIGYEKTPLERRLDSLVKRLAGISIAAGALVAAIELLKRTPIGHVLETGLAVAVAAVPEGLPAVVTITMALGLRRMARRHAVVRRLPCVETLGAATVVCADKTGTLTAGEQTVTTIWIMDRTIDVTGAGWAPLGTFREAGRTLDPACLPALHNALHVAALASLGDVTQSERGWTAHGDPTDAALIVAARKARVDRSALAAQYTQVGQLPFSSARMLTATFHRRPDGGIVAFVKGAPHRVLDRCTRIDVGGTPHTLGDVERARVIELNETLAGRGLRVIALASGTVDAAAQESVHGLVFDGLAGLSDPPAAGAKEAVHALRTAGIRTIMLTGDQQLTATTIARDLGVLTEGDDVLAARDLESMPNDELAHRMARVAVVSRLSAEAKLRIIASLQQRGDVVAMLGDGINDAPALRKADIGVAMGRRGTDLAKDAAAVILTDDRFHTIVAAVEEGRTIYDNIRKFSLYLLSCNLGEILALLGAGLAMLPLPLTPLQILWLNLVTDTFPALALAVEAPDPNVMRHPPRDPKQPLLSARLLRLAAWYAVLIAGVTLGTFSVDLFVAHHTEQHARTMAFTTLALAQLLHLGNARSESAVRTIRHALSNRYALAAVALALALQISAVTYSPLARVLSASRLGAVDWVIAVAFALVPAVAGQAAKLLASARP